MIQLDLKLLEKVMKLMVKYQIEDFASEHFTLKAPHRDKKARKPYTYKKDVVEVDKEFLDKYTNPMSNEPWMSIEDSVIEEYIQTGKS